MKNETKIGLGLFIAGIILIYAYIGLNALQNIDIASIPIAVLIGAIAVVIGIIILLVSIFFEQTSDMKKRKKEIPKEDFEP
jgi:uncharacterized membrane protein HdeD (DUF308 family)